MCVYIFAYAARAGRAPKPKSRVELEEDLMASFSVFKARPVRRLIQRYGDMKIEIYMTMYVCVCVCICVCVCVCVFIHTQMYMYVDK